MAASSKIHSIRHPIRDTARKYIRSLGNVVELRPHTKKPVREDWQEHIVKEADLNSEFPLVSCL